MDTSGSEASEPESEPEIAEDVYTNQADFLRKIHPRFLTTVQPIQSGLMDDFIADGIMSSDDEKEISSEKTRKDKARKLWCFLRQVPPALFELKCLPAMKKHYPHVLENATFHWDGQEDRSDRCLRHIIMKRMRLRRFADIFPPANACTLAEYRTITESSDLDETKWDLAFQLCVKHKNNVELGDMLRKVLMNIGVQVSENISLLLSNGLLCTCQHIPATGKRRRKMPGTTQTSRETPKARGHKRGSPIDGLQNLDFQKRPCGMPEMMSRACESSSGYPSTKDDKNDDEGYSVSISSTESREMIVNGEEDDKRETQFETREHKEIYLKVMEEINAVITKASNIRTLFRELTGVKEELSILTEKPKSETSESSSFRDYGKIQRLKARVAVIYRTLERDFNETSALTKRIEDKKGDFDFQLPFAYKSMLLVRQQTLVNEMKEATPFFGQSRTLYTNMTRSRFSCDFYLL